MNPGQGDNRAVRFRVIDPDRIATGAALAGLSARKLAARVGWSSHTYLLRILSGRVRSVSPEVGARIAAELGMGVDALFLPEVTGNPGRGDQPRGDAREVAA